MNRPVWQVSAGPSSRSYKEVFLRHGVALLGPGDAGPWHKGRPDDAFGGDLVRRFAEELQPGDILLLRTGIAQIAAVGIVEGTYLYLNQFDDVNGWDLQHARRVRWCRLPAEYTFEGRPFGANPPRLSRVRNEEVLDFAHRFVRSPPTGWQNAPLPPLPKEEPLLERPPDELADLVGYAADLIPLVEDAERFGDYPSEAEMVAHLVVPLLRALGWPPEQIAIQWRSVDVALFRALPRCPEHCSFLIEVKRLGAGVEEALEQAKGYLEKLGARGDVVVTDGVRYRLYASGQGFKPVAYANLARLRPSALAFFDALRWR